MNPVANSIISNINDRKFNFNKTNNSNFQDTINAETEKKLTEEEDKILYENLKKAGVDLKNHSLEWQKEHITAFPPLTAPGSVRKSWREALSTLPEEQRARAAFFANIMYNEELKKDQPSDNRNSSDKLYINAAEYMLDKIEELKSFISGNDYSSFKRLISNFKSGLNKY